MTDRPIIFSAPMVRALLDGRKTQTRRVLKPQPTPCGGKLHGAIYSNDFYWPLSPGHGIVSCKPFPPISYLEEHPLRYATGDRLWVRENCATWQGDTRDVIYRADDEEEYRLAVADAKHGAKWKPRPSIHMPRWASRLTLTVIDVRVQRLQEISEGDAWAEGCKRGDPWDSGQGFFPAEEPSPDGHGWVGWDDAKEWFSDLWDNINGPDAWDANPWVVALTFTVQRGNIDEQARHD